jgi:hypothetical protein
MLTEGCGMKALVVYESLYGNTAAVGEAIAQSLRAHGLEVEAGTVSKISPTATAGFDLLVVGGPTHAHGMSKPQSRRQADRDEKNTYAERTVDPGAREWLAALPQGAGRLAAAFDTRIDKAMLLTGSAAKGIAQLLKKNGCALVLSPECFLVSMQNRLKDGELRHADEWGATLAMALAQRGSSESA